MPKGKYSKTIRDQVRDLMSDGKTRTCMQILHQLGDPCNSDSLSSSLLQMSRKGELKLIAGFGPRGGRGYRKVGQVDRGYECHLTFLADAAEQVKRQATGWWKFSVIDGDPVLGQKAYCYLTAYHHYFKAIEEEMQIKIDEINSYGLPLVRAKIEHIIYDQRC